MVYKCVLTTSEGNGHSFYEIGLFSDHPTEGGEKLMVAYGTFPEEIKTPADSLENHIILSFGR